MINAEKEQVKELWNTRLVEKMDNVEVKSCYRKAILHNYIPWNGYPDITKRVKVVAEVNYYNGDKGYLCTSYDHNARLQRVHKDYIEFLGEKEMSNNEFIEKLRKLDPFFHEGDIPLDMLYEHFKTTVAEMERLEDIEDNTAVMQACIDGLRQEIKKLKKLLNG